MAKRETGTVDAARIRRVARDAFGFEALRDGQEQAIAAVAGGRDVLVVMPTGSGKSAIYQVAGLLRGGMSLVVSPLLALQRDQVEALREQRPESGEVAALNSTLTKLQREELLDRVADGAVAFLFLAPEQFSSGDTLERLQASPPSLFVVDEAHCIAEWGHDFRPDYLRLGAARTALGGPPVLALTATAAGPVRDEIVERLEMRDPVVIVHGFDRPNLRLVVEPVTGEPQKLERLRELLPELGRPGIVYVATRQHADQLAERLRGDGHAASAYHAGLGKDQRRRIQAEFMDDELDAVVATVAFGMGIDKPRVAFVIHYDLPGTLDAYYQQIGRAGRDGEPATAALLYDPDDIHLQRFLQGAPAVDAEVLEQVVEAVDDVGGTLGVDQLSQATGLSVTQLQSVLNQLADIGAIETDGHRAVRRSAGAPSGSEAAEAAERLQERHKAFEASRVAMMRDYAETPSCRRAFLMSYFGERFEPPCENCDRCLAGEGEPATENGPFAVGARVDHDSFGEGQVVRYEEGKVVVLFDEIGYQSLALDVVRGRGVLREGE